MRSSRVPTLARFGAAAAVVAVAMAGALAPIAASAGTKGHHHGKAPTNIVVNAHFLRGSHHKTDVINGQLRSKHHGVAGESIALECRTAHTKFATVGSATTDANGKVSFTVTPTKKTSCKLVFAGDATHRKSHSAVVVLRPAKHHKK
jgi:hypothetical protein